MTLARRILVAGRAHICRDGTAGTVSLAEVRVLLAEIEAALDAPASELAQLGERTSLDDRNSRGYPTTPRTA